MAMNGNEEEQALIEQLRARGQRVTPQRIVIHRLLRERQRHMTADQVREEVVRDLPGTSAPTVYATLELLVELGLLRRLDAGAGAALYDSRMTPHHHTVCRSCGRVEDLDGAIDTASALRAAEGSGFHTEQVDVLVGGCCRACSADD